MFKNLTDFGFKRNHKQALGFYIAYLLFIMLSSGLLGAIIGTIVQPAAENAFAFGVKIGTVVAIIICTVLSFIVIHKKKCWKHLGDIFLAILAGLLAAFIGGLGGLIPVAYLTTRK